MSNTPFSVRLSDAVAAEVARRHEPVKQGEGGKGRTAFGRSNVVDRDLARHYALINATQVQLRERFAPNERAALAAALGNSAWEPWSIPYLIANVEDAIRLDGLAEQFGLDEDFAAVVRLLTPLECFALVDMVERAMIAGDAAP